MPRYEEKLQYFGHLMQSVDSLEKTLMLGGIGGRRRRGRQRMRWLDGPHPRPRVSRAHQKPAPKPTPSHCWFRFEKGSFIWLNCGRGVNGQPRKQVMSRSQPSTAPLPSTSAANGGATSTATEAHSPQQLLASTLSSTGSGACFDFQLFCFVQD